MSIRQIMGWLVLGALAVVYNELLPENWPSQWFNITGRFEILVEAVGILLIVSALMEVLWRIAYARSLWIRSAKRDVLVLAVGTVTCWGIAFLPEMWACSLCVEKLVMPRFIVGLLTSYLWMRRVGSPELLEDLKRSR